MFEPIAITASASVLPGARSVEELWTAIAEARDLTSDAAAGAWGAGSSPQAMRVVARTAANPACMRVRSFTSEILLNLTSSSTGHVNQCARKRPDHDQRSTNELYEALSGKPSSLRRP